MNVRSKSSTVDRSWPVCASGLRGSEGAGRRSLINLLTNAHEAGSAPENVHVAVNSANGSGVVLGVLDRGHGMNSEEMERATLPFYSSKVSGTGLGLALCCEIVEAHGGHVRLRNREGGGVVVSCWLPAAPR